MDPSELIRFFQHLRERARELNPDYPGIQGDLDPWDHLWSITTSCEGVRLACDDLHKFITFLAGQLGWSYEQALEHYEKQEKVK